MANENEPAKLLLPYLQRADELQKHEPLVAYYCRLYAMERGLKIPQSERTKTTNSLLISLMKQLEKDKKSLTLGPDDSLHIEGFALSVFGKADKQDRAGRADKSTAKTFYAASIFFEILNQFGQLQPDLEQKQKYAAWKAADISKALKEGRKPVPGPPGGNNEDATPNAGYDIEPSRIDPATRPAPEFDQSTQVHDKVEPTQTPNIPPVPPSNIPPSPYPTNNYVSHNFPQPPSADDYPSHSFHQPPSSDDYPSHSFHQPPSSDDYPSHSLHQPASGDDYPSHSFHQPPPTDDYPSHNFLQPPPVNKSENSTYSQPPYQHQPFPLEPQQHSPQYQPPETNYSYLPNFQTYPSFTETSLPAAPSHVPSYYQGSDSSYSAPPASGTPNYPSTAQLTPNARNGPISDTAPTSAQGYQYDSNYQPSPEKIAEAHKAARFAVGALAFDDVSIAVDYLRKSLELLTNPSAGQ